MKLSTPPRHLQLAKHHTRAIRLLTASFSITSVRFQVPINRKCSVSQKSLFCLITRSNVHAMSSFSNTDTGNKPADPYKAKNLDDASIKEKVEDLSEFISNCKFGMMTTRDGTTGRLVSRCMALAAKVCPLSHFIHKSCHLPIVCILMKYGGKHNRAIEKLGRNLSKMS
jgi:hypothetical protein